MYSSKSLTPSTYLLTFCGFLRSALASFSISLSLGRILGWERAVCRVDRIFKIGVLANLSS